MTISYAASGTGGGPPGNNGNSGLSELLPKLTLTAAAALATTVGDRYRANKSDTFRETVTSPFANIICEYYGSGAAPIITGSDNIASFTGPGPIWDKAVAIQPFIVVVAGRNPKNMAASRAACVAIDDWFWTAGTLSVFYPTDPSGLVEAGQRDFTIDNGFKTDLTFDGLTLTGANLVGNASLNAHLAPHRMVLKNMNITKNAGMGVQCGNPDAFQLINSSLTWNGSIGIFFNTDSSTNLSVLGNDISFNGWKTGMSAAFACGMLAAILTGEVAYNTFISNGLGSPGAQTEHGLYLNSVTGSSVNIHHNYGKGNTSGCSIKVKTSCTLSYNIAEANFQGHFCGQNAAIPITVVMHHNLVLNQLDIGVYEANKGTAAINLTLYHETIYNSSTANAVGRDLKIEDNIEFFTMKNCIIYSFSPIRTVGFQVAMTGTIVINNNVYWQNLGAPDFVVNAVFYNFAQWQATFGYDAQGRLGNPLFNNVSSGGFRLQVGSPAVDMGAIIAGINDGTGGSVKYTGALPDAGAFEFSFGAITSVLTNCSDIVTEL